MEIIIDIDDSVPLFAQLIGQIKKAVLCDKIGQGMPCLRFDSLQTTWSLTTKRWRKLTVY